MIEAFKTGGKLPKRVVWEIILGVKAIVDKERSMVSRTVEEGVVCDVIGDTHGVSGQSSEPDRAKATDSFKQSRAMLTYSNSLTW
jgi:hypothetical protein